MNGKISRVIDILNQRIEKMPLDVSLAGKTNGKWKKYSSSEFVSNVNALSLGLLELGIKPTEKVAIISSNRPEWNFADFAIQQIKAVSVPMYPNITVDDYTYIFNDADVKIVFVESEELVNKVIEATKKLETPPSIYTFNTVEGQKHWKEAQEIGKVRSVEEIKPLSDSIKPEDLVTLIYTSGTTGRPKGVMLSNENLISNVLSVNHLLPVDQGARILSFLPLCHVFERITTYVYMYKGTSIY